MAGPIEDLQAAGFSDDEVASWAQERRGTLAAAGFQDNEIDSYFTGGVTAPDRVPDAVMKRVADKSLLSDIGDFAQGGLEKIVKNEPDKDLGEAVYAYAIKNGMTPEQAKVQRETIESRMQRGNILTLAGPLELIASPILGAFRNLVSRPIEEAGGPPKEVTEGFTMVGAAAVGVGRGMLRKPSGEPIGTLPESSDFVNAATVTGSDKLPVQEKFLKLYEERGLHPAEVAEAAQADPVVQQKMLSSEPKDLPGAPPKEPPPREPKAPEPPEPGSFDEAQRKILDKISVGDREPSKLTLRKLYTEAVDDLHPIKGVDEDAYQIARLTRGQFGKAEQFLEYGTFDFNTYKTSGKGLRDILDPVKDDLDGFRAYLASKRAIELDVNGPPLPENPFGTTISHEGRTAHIKTGKGEGDLSLEIKDDGVYVGIASVSRAMRGKGIATDMYERAAKFAAARGVPLRSDIAVSADAARIYASLKRRGYDVTMEPSAVKHADGSYSASNSRTGYVFEVKPGDRIIGKRSGFDLVAAQEVAARGDARFGKAAAEIVDYQNSLIKYLKDSGVLSDRAYDAMVEANKNYVPFYRVFFPNEGPPGTKGFGPGNPIKALKGSERGIIDPLESIIKNTYAYVSIAERNAAGLKIIDALKEQGFKSSTKAPKFEGAEADLVDYLKQNGVHDAEALIDFVKSTAADEGTTIQAWRGGKREGVETNDAELVRAFRNLDQESVNMVTKVLAVPARALRAGAVLTPDFMARNLIRDLMTAFINSRGLFSPIDTARGLASVIKKDADFQNWLKSGGANSTMVALDRRYMQESLSKLDADTGLMSRSWNVVKNPLAPLRMVSELIENATRLGEFKKVAAGATDKASLQKAAFASREVTLDFARKGASMRAYNMIVAFANAQLQGVDRIGRAFVDRPVNTTAKIAAGITLPSVLLWFANHDDPRYQELPDWQKDLFWIVMTDDHIYRIPKPFEVGIVFGSGVERALEATIGQNKEAFRGFSKSVVEAFTPGIVPTAVLPVVEQFANRSTFTDRTLIPADLEKQLPEYQYTPYTTELSKALGQAISAFPGMRETAVEPGALGGAAARALTTPILIENYIRGWTGGTGNYLLQATDYTLRKAGVLPDPIRPTPTLADIPFVKAFAVRYPSATTESIQRFYDDFERNKRYFDTWMAKANEGDQAAVQRIQEAGGPMMFTRMDGLKQTLAEHSKLIRDIYKAPDMPADEKRQLIDGLYFAMIMIAKDGRETMKAAQAQFAP